MKRVYIVIVNWNGSHDTVECLESLIHLNYPYFTVIIIDNCSYDNSLEMIKLWCEYNGLKYIEFQSDEHDWKSKLTFDWHLVVIKNSMNLGFAGGNNVGIRYALARGDAEYIWLLNNDTVVDPNALRYLVNRMEQDPLVGICGSTIHFYDEPDKIQAMGGGYYCHWIGFPLHYGRGRVLGKKINQHKAEKWMNYVEGASMLVARKFIEENGLMCEDYFLYFEEADWAIRAKGRFKLAYAPMSIVFHKVGRSIGTSSNPVKKSLTCDYYNIRNRILFTQRFYPLALPIVYIVLIGTLILRLCLGRWGRVWMIIRLLFGYKDAQYEIISNFRA